MLDSCLLKKLRKKPKNERFVRQVADQFYFFYNCSRSREPPICKQSLSTSDVFIFGQYLSFSISTIITIIYPVGTNHIKKCVDFSLSLSRGNRIRALGLLLKKLLENQSISVIETLVEFLYLSF